MKVLFVCYGNICRSPMAEALFSRYAADRGALKDVDVASAGVGAIAGGRATSWTREVMRERCNLDLDGHRATRLTALTSADLILAMDDETLRWARELGPSGRIELLGDYAGTREEVQDPYGRRREDYDLCVDRIDRLVRVAAERLAAELALSASPRREERPAAGDQR